MEHVTLTGTDLKVSRICLGCWQMNGGTANVNWDAQSQETSQACVDKCLELGINFFDTAEGYAGSEEVLGKCLQGKRRDAIIATKFGFREGPHTPPYSAAQIDEAITKSLRKLQTDYIDLLQEKQSRERIRQAKLRKIAVQKLHRIHFPSFVADIDDAVKELNRQVSLGRLRNYGVCNYGPKNMKELFAKGVKPVSNQIGYNLLWRSPEHEVIPICKENNITLLAYSPLQQGLLTGNYMTCEDVPEGRRRGKLFAPESAKVSRHGTPGCEKEVFESLRGMKDICTKAGVPMGKAALSWVLQQDCKPVVIVGCRTPEQVADNANIIKLSDDVIKQLTDVTEPVKAKIGLALDQWVNPDRCE